MYSNSFRTPANTPANSQGLSRTDTSNSGRSGHNHSLGRLVNSAVSVLGEQILVATRSHNNPRTPSPFSEVSSSFGSWATDFSFMTSNSAHSSVFSDSPGVYSNYSMQSASARPNNSPTHLNEPHTTFNPVALIKDQRTFLRQELHNWLTDAPPVEQQARQEASIKIISNFHHRGDVLEIHNPQLTELPNCLGILEHLSVLDVSGCTSLKTLPNVLHNFQRLQTLNLRDCTGMNRLPPTATAMRWYTRTIIAGSGIKLADPLGSANPAPQSGVNR